MVHSSVCRASAAVAVIVFVGCCIVRVGGRWLVVAGAVVVAMVFTVAIAGVVFAIVLAGVVVLARVGGRSRDGLHCHRCGCHICNRPCGSCRPRGSRGSLSWEPSSSRSSSPSLLWVSSSQSSLWKSEARRPRGSCCPHGSRGSYVTIRTRFTSFLLMTHLPYTCRPP